MFELRKLGVGEGSDAAIAAPVPTRASAAKPRDTLMARQTPVGTEGQGLFRDLHARIDA